MTEILWHALVRLVVVFTLLATVIAVLDRLRLGTTATQCSWLWRTVYFKSALLLVAPTLGMIHFSLGHIAEESMAVERIEGVMAGPIPTKNVAQAGTVQAGTVQAGPVLSNTAIAQSIDMLNPSDQPLRSGEVTKSAKNSDWTWLRMFKSIKAFFVANQSILQTWLVAAWITGVMIWWSVMLRNYVRVVRSVRSAKPIGQSELYTVALTVARRMKVRLPSCILLSEKIDSPMILSMGKTVLVLPTAFQEQYGMQSCRMAIAHELSHYRRGDLWWNFLASSVSSLLFFWPPSWYAARRYYLQMESACDQLAISRASFDPQEYATLLVQLWQSQSLRPINPAMVSMAHSRDFTTIKERLKNMSYDLRSKRSVGTILSLLVMLIIASPWAIGDDEAKNKSRSEKRRSGSASGKSNLEFSSSPSQTPPAAPGTTVQGFAHASAGGFASGSSGGSGSSFGSGGSSGSGNSFGSGNSSSSGRSNGFGATGGSGIGTAQAGGFASAGVSIGTPMDQSSARSFSPGSASPNSTREGTTGQKNSTSSGSTVSSGNGISVTRSVDELDGVSTVRTTITTRKERVVIEESSVDGIVVTVQPRNKPRSEKKSYEAQDREELKEKHPEVFDWVEKYSTNLPNASAVGQSNPFTDLQIIPAKPNATDLMQKQIQQMIQNTDDPMMKQQLERLLQSTNPRP